MEAAAGGRCTLIRRQPRIGSISTHASGDGRVRVARDVSGRHGHDVTSGAPASSVATCSQSVGKGSVITDRSAANRYAPPGRSSPEPTAAARRRRRARLRSTAVPNPRPMAYATLGGSSEPSVRKRSETGPALCRRAPARASNVARSRTGQIRPRDASGHGRGGRAGQRDPPWCACGGGNRGSWRACDCWAGTCASTKSLLEAVAAARSRGPRGRRKRTSVRVRRAPTQCGAESGENPRDPLSHKDAGATLRAPLGDGPARWTSHERHRVEPGRPVEHLCHDLHTCGRSCGQLRRRWTRPEREPPPQVAVERRTVSVDGRRDLGPGFGDPPGPARACHLGRLVPRRAPPQLRR